MASQQNGSETITFASKDQLLQAVGAPQGVKIDEFRSAVQCTRKDVNELKEKIVSKASDPSEIERILKEFVENKSSIRQEARSALLTESQMREKAEIDEITRKLQVFTDNFSIENLKKSLELIENTEGKYATYEKGYWTNLLLDKLEQTGYSIILNKDSVVIHPQDKPLSRGIGDIFNTYVKEKRFDMDNLKKAIIYRTSKYNEYISTISDSTKTPLIKDYDAKTYAGYLKDTSQLSKEWIITENDIRTNRNLTRADANFLLSVESGAYEGFRLNELADQYAFEKDRIGAISKNPKVIETYRNLGPKKTPRTPEQKVQGALTSPLGEILNMSKTHPLGALAIMAAIVYAIYKHPLQSIGAIAGITALDYFGGGIANYLQSDAHGASSQPSAKPKEGEPKKGDAQEKATNAVNGSDLKTVVDKNAEGKKKDGKEKAATTAEYLAHINSVQFQDVKNVKALIYPENKNASIFNFSKELDPSIKLPEGFDPLIFKSMLRMYLLGAYKFKDADQGAPVGQHELQTLEQKGGLDRKKSENMKFSELVNNVYSSKA